MPLRFYRRTAFVYGLATATSLLAAYAPATAFAQANAPASGPSGSLKIGVIGPFTGPSSDFGIPMLQGVQLAAEQINAGGGYMGRPLTLVIKDDQGNPDVGLKGSQELAAEGVTATIGFCNTGRLMGMDHEKLTYLYQGRNMRLTDVKGEGEFTKKLVV